MTWMKHAETGGIADLPDLPYWRGAGWEPTDDRPQELDTLRDPAPQQPTEATEATEAPGLSAAVTTEPAAAPKTKKETGRG